MTDEDAPVSQERVDRELAFGVEDPSALSANPRALKIMVRNYMFRLVQLFALEREERLEQLLDYLENYPDISDALDDYFEQYTDLDTGPEARGPEYFHLDASARSRLWPVRQIIRDPEGNNDFQFVATVDLDASDDAGEVRLRICVSSANECCRKNACYFATVHGWHCQHSHAMVIPWFCATLFLLISGGH